MLKANKQKNTCISVVIEFSTNVDPFHTISRNEYNHTVFAESHMHYLSLWNFTDGVVELFSNEWETLKIKGGRNARDTIYGQPYGVNNRAPPHRQKNPTHCTLMWLKILLPVRRSVINICWGLFSLLSDLFFFFALNFRWFRPPHIRVTMFFGVFIWNSK